MGFFKKLKKSISIKKLKKIQPGKLVKGALNAAAAVGIPGAKTAANLANRIGAKVDQANRVISKTKAEIERLAREQGISVAEATEQVADRALKAADVGLTASRSMPVLLIGAVVVGAFLVFGRRR